MLAKHSGGLRASCHQGKVTMRVSGLDGRKNMRGLWCLEVHKACHVPAAAWNQNVTSLRACADVIMEGLTMRPRRVETTEECIWSCLELRTGASPSISSKKMIEGW